MSTPLTNEKLAAIKSSIFAGRTIEAIKLYRQATHAGLAEAKDAIEKLDQELRISSPEEFAKTPSRTGCLGFFLAVFCALGVLILLILLR